MASTAKRTLAKDSGTTRGSGGRDESLTVEGMRVSVCLRPSGLDGSYVVTPWNQSEVVQSFSKRLLGDLKSQGEEVGAYDLGDDMPAHGIVRDPGGKVDSLHGEDIRVLVPNDSARQKVLKLLKYYATKSKSG